MLERQWVVVVRGANSLAVYDCVFSIFLDGLRVFLLNSIIIKRIYFAMSSGHAIFRLIFFWRG